ncbi:MAG: hypothetical protein LW715_07410 [Rhodobacter sp.]|jgi:hypothetical protein|nr:hypothetical protein [Rhodobacter sp.]
MRKKTNISRRAVLASGLGATTTAMIGRGCALADTTKIGFALETCEVTAWKYLDPPSFQADVEAVSTELIAVQADFDADMQIEQVRQLITGGCGAIAGHAAGQDCLLRRRGAKSPARPVGGALRTALAKSIAINETRCTERGTAGREGRTDLLSVGIQAYSDVANANCFGASGVARLSRQYAR